VWENGGQNRILNQAKNKDTQDRMANPYARTIFCPPPLRWSVMLAGGIPAGKRLHDPFTHVWLMWGLEQILPPQTKILEELSNGELVTVLCRRDDMPNLSTLQRWRRDDEGFDDRC